jgi:hypothetical protein
MRADRPTQVHEARCAQLTRHYYTREVALGHEHGHDVHVVAVDTTQRIADPWAFLPERDVHFIEKPLVPDARRVFIDRRTGITVEARAVADE